MTRSPADVPPLVCLHKLGGWAREWDGLAAVLPERRVIALDLPRQGEPPHVQRVEESADAILRALDDGERFDLVGCSLGGAVAVRIAAVAPDRVASLTLISVALTPATDEAEMQRIDARGDGTLYDVDDRPIDRSAADMEQMFGVTDPMVQHDLAAARRAVGRWIRPSWRGASLADVLGWLGQVGAPVRLVYGERGGYRQYEAAGRAVRPDIASIVIPDSGAFPHQERPAAVAALFRG